MVAVLMCPDLGVLQLPLWWLRLTPQEWNHWLYWRQRLSSAWGRPRPRLSPWPPVWSRSVRIEGVVCPPWGLPVWLLDIACSIVCTCADRARCDSTMDMNCGSLASVIPATVSISGGAHMSPGTDRSALVATALSASANSVSTSSMPSSRSSVRSCTWFARFWSPILESVNSCLILLL